MPAVSAELIAGAAVLCSVVLPALVALKTLRSVPKEKEPVLREEYELREKYRAEQIEGLKAQLHELNTQVDENEDAFKGRLEDLVKVLNDLRCDIAGIASAIRHHFGEK